MAVNMREPVDPVMEAIAAAVRNYTNAHPSAEADIYRYSPVSVRVRVVDPDFRGKSRSERHKIVWPLLYALDADILADLTILLLLAPDELESSIANRDFDTPVFAAEYAAALKAVSGGGAATP
ncbi:hypothetical protein VT84_05415 [Gemmata sp. SH-PL17]|nr:hypothetical protein VT84_05415 [Gemmata sp. SH-PL17]